MVKHVPLLCHGGKLDRTGHLAVGLWRIAVRQSSALPGQAFLFEGMQKSSLT